MAYPKRELEIVPECNDENDIPRCWAIRSEYDQGGNRYHYIWICQYSEDEYLVENSYGHNLAGKTYKTLRGAKRAAEEIIWRQEETGCFSN